MNEIMNNEKATSGNDKQKINKAENRCWIIYGGSINISYFKYQGYYQ